MESASRLMPAASLVLQAVTVLLLVVIAINLASPEIPGAAICSEPANPDTGAFAVGKDCNQLMVDRLTELANATPGAPQCETGRSFTKTTVRCDQAVVNALDGIYRAVDQPSADQDVIDELEAIHAVLQDIYFSQP